MARRSLIVGGLACWLVGACGSSSNSPTPVSSAPPPTPSPTPTPVCNLEVSVARFDPESIDCVIGQRTALDIGLVFSVTERGTSGASIFGVQFDRIECQASPGAGCSVQSTSGTFSTPAGSRVGPGQTVQFRGSYRNLSCNRTQDQPGAFPSFTIRHYFSPLRLGTSCGAFNLESSNAFTTVWRY